MRVPPWRGRDRARGNPVIIDEMLLDARVRDDWFTVLKPFAPFVVGVYCSLETLIEREERRTSRCGLARWSATLNPM